jgi:NitT/TauT family transport system substrate-binding protein
VLLIADEGYNPYVGVLITRKKIWDEKPAMVRAFVAAAREGWRAYLTDPKPANAIMAKLNTSMDAQTFQEAADAQKALIEAEPLGKMTKERWDTLSKQLTDIAVLKGAAPTDFLVDL